jgi:hypothetical protein
MKAKIIFCAAALAFCRPAGAQVTTTLNTYYPAPLGVYTSIVTSSTTQLGTAGGNVTLAAGGGNVIMGAGGGKVGVNTSSPQGILDVTSTTSGFIPPRMTTTQRTSISSPAAGTMVYDTLLNAPYYWNGSAWKAFNSAPTMQTWSFSNQNYEAYTITTPANTTSTIIISYTMEVPVGATGYTCNNYLQFDGTTLIDGANSTGSVVTNTRPIATLVGMTYGVTGGNHTISLDITGNCTETTFNVLVMAWEY